MPRHNAAQEIWAPRTGPAAGRAADPIGKITPYVLVAAPPWGLTSGRGSTE